MKIAMKSHDELYEVLLKNFTIQVMAHSLEALASSENLLIRQNSRPHSRPMESKSVFSQNPQVICMLIEV